MSYITMPDSYTIIMKQNLRFQVEICPDQVKNLL